MALAGALVTLALVIAAVSAAVGPGGDEPHEGGQTAWAGPGGEPLEEPVGSWTRAEDPPFSPRQAAFGGTLRDGRVLVWGGTDSNGDLATDGGIYDPSTGEWDRIPPAPSSATYTAPVRQTQLAGDRLVLLTSEAGFLVESVDAAIYDATQGMWLAAPTLDLRSDLVGDVNLGWDGETLAVVVGQDIPTIYDSPSTWRWRVGEATWSPGAPAPIGARTGAGTAFDRRRLAMWGGSINGRLQTDGAIYDVPSDTWELVPAAPISGGEYPMVVWSNGRVMVSPSTVNAPVPEEQFEDVGHLAAYDPVTGKWERLPRSPDFVAPEDYPYTLSDGTTYEPSSRWFQQPATTTRYVVSGRSRNAADAPGGHWFLESQEWELAPSAGLLRLGTFTVAVGGLDTSYPCCSNPSELNLQVRISTERWLEAAEVPFEMRTDETVVATGDKLVVVGGLQRNGSHARPTPIGDAWVFDLAG